MQIADAGGQQILTVSDRQAANNFTKRFLRLEVTQLASPSLLPPPENLSGTPLGMSAISLTWQVPTFDADEFIVEAQDWDGQTWGAISETPPTQLFTLASGLYPGTSYQYRVRLRSAAGVISNPSNVVTVSTRPDTDGDGTGDDDENNHGTDPNNPDSDGDGVSDTDELAAGMNPNSADSDSDGMRDTFDLFPLDNRRSRNLEGVVQGVSLAANFQGAPQTMRWITIDEASRFALAADHPEPPPPPEVPETPPTGIRVLAWGDGELASDKVAPNSRQYDADPAHIVTYFATGLGADGTLWGDANPSWLQESWAFTWRDGEFEEFGPPASFHPDADYFRGASLAGRSDNGKLFGTYSATYSTPPEENGPTTFTAIFMGTPGNFLEQASPHIFLLNSPDGLALYRTANNSFVTWTEGTTFVPAPLPTGCQPYSMNDQYRMVGALDPTLSSSYDQNGFPLGFFYDGQSTVTFAGLLPLTYRKAIRGAIPTQITNPDGHGVTRVTFYGESLEGPDPGVW